MYLNTFEKILTSTKSTKSNYYAYIKILKLTMKLDKFTQNDYIKNS